MFGQHPHRAPLRALLAAAVAALALLLLSAATAGATSSITGIADENLDEWGPATWSVFEGMGVKQVRHIVSWNVAKKNAKGEFEHSAEMTEVKNWVTAAKAHGLEITISFNHVPLPCDHNKVGCEYPAADWAPSAVEYLNAVANFRETFPEIKTYTAWDEPNHHLYPPKHPEQDPNPGSYPELAAAYWVNLNFVCHTAKYGPNCDVAGGDFLEGSNATELSKYMSTYRTTLAGSGVSPSEWAIHPYTAAETGSATVLKEGFLPQTEGKPIWFTEVGGMVCRAGGEYTGTAKTLQSAEQFENESAGHLLDLIGELSGRVQRTYYYALAAVHDTETACEPGKGIWDSELLGANGHKRPAYYTLFPPPAKAETSPASLLNSSTDEKWVYYVNNEGYLTELFWGGKHWGCSVFSNAPVLAGTSPTAILDESTGHKWVYYVNSSSHVTELYWNGSSWTNGPFSATARAGTSPVAIYKPSTGEKWVYYNDASGDVGELFWTGSTWSNTVFSIAPELAGTSPTAVLDAPSGQKWVYYVNSSSHVTELYWSGTGWTNGPFGAVARGGTSPTVIYRPSTGEKWVYYNDASGDVGELFWSGSSWSNNIFATSPTLAATSPAAILDTSSGHKWVYYVNSSSNVTELYWNGSSWTNGPFGSVARAGTSPTATYRQATGEKWIYYNDASGHIGELFWNGSAWSTRTF